MTARLRLLSLTLIATLALVLRAEAQQSSASIPAANATGAAAAETTTVSAEKTPKAVPAVSSTLLLGFKSYNTSARVGYMRDTETSPTKGRIYNGKQEAFLGYRFENQWGGFVQATQYKQQYNNSQLDRWSVSDPSLTLIHPDLYDNGFLHVTGQLRGYLPYTDRSKTLDIRQYAYYSNQIFSLGNGQEVFNQVVPRYFAANSYAPGDTTWYLEDRVIFTKKINSWCKLGLGNWLQIEQHSATATGYSDEVIPQVDFLISRNFSFGPRISLPIFALNAVYDGPKNATFEEARGELFFQATL
jgi:hypothetical protein